MDVEQDGEVLLEHVAPALQKSMYTAHLSESTSGLVVDLAAQVKRCS